MEESKKDNLIIVPEGQKAYLIKEKSSIYGTEQEVIPIEQAVNANRISKVEKVI